MKKIVSLLVAALVLSCSKNDCNCKEEKNDTPKSVLLGTWKITKKVENGEIKELYSDCDANETFVFQEKEAINESFKKGKFNLYDDKLECRSQKEVYPTYEYKKEENKLYLEIEVNRKTYMMPQKITLENNNTQLTIYHNYDAENNYKVYTKQK
ncbi:lipocalin family protein [Capnocytophaga granulosa]|uniref:lipocalin family protein n=1 Tax=Capnocytophaga granulosa TaxID=45242 RepID=UPI003857B75B